MVWIFILLACAIVIGPIALLKPSTRQKQLMEYRSYATKKGLFLNSSVPKVISETSEQQLMGYGISIGSQLDSFKFLLKRSNTKHEINLADFWYLEQKNQNLPLELTKLLDTLLLSIPDNVKGIEISQHGITVFWNEFGGTALIDSLYEFLTSVKEFYA